MAATLGTRGLVLLDAGAAARLHRLDGHQNDGRLAVVTPYGNSVRCADNVIVSRSR